MIQTLRARLRLGRLLQRLCGSAIIFSAYAASQHSDFWQIAWHIARAPAVGPVFMTVALDTRNLLTLLVLMLHLNTLGWQ